uniref:Pleckstrin homology domain containing, family O member 2 n=1 Tax=Nothobranchius furzeri TaxID=105023 RepID=A0A8C6NSH7_NOTFU
MDQLQVLKVTNIRKSGEELFICSGRGRVKAGWVKKAHGRLLTSYKERYVHVEKTEMVVYENEDLKNCLERLDLENYDTCHELKSPFKKKHRLILIRSPKSGHKVHDLKFQTQTAEEKDAWIKALSDGINRAKNKVFDEVKVDESSNLEHVTRTRPKGNRNRRPPTRIHMKEVCVCVIQRQAVNSFCLETSGKLFKHVCLFFKKPPMPPSKEAKPAEEASEDPKTGAKKKTGPPPTPPGKPLISTTTVRPPTPPSKETKPCQAAEEPTKEDDSGSETAVGAKEELNVLPHLSDNDPESSTAEGDVSDGITQEVVSNTRTSDPAERPPLSTQHPEEPSVISQPKGALDSDDSAGPLPALEVPLQSKVPLVAVSDADPLTDSFGLSPLLSNLAGEKKKKAEEKSVDSGQHSDDESEGSGSEDTLAASTSALQGSHVALDVLDVVEDNIQTSVHLRPAAELQVRSNTLSYCRSEPNQKPPKPPSKPRSVSIGDLLSESSGSPQLELSSSGAPDPIVTKLEAEVALEIQRTSELLSKAQGEGNGGGMPEELLGKALEKRKKADHVLKEVQKLKRTKSSSSRMSW